MSEQVREATRRFRSGEIVVATEDDDRENDGELVGAASPGDERDTAPRSVRVAETGLELESARRSDVSPSRCSPRRSV
jgi:hypothetical protein